MVPSVRSKSLVIEIWKMFILMTILMMMLMIMMLIMMILMLIMMTKPYDYDDDTDDDNDHKNDIYIDFFDFLHSFRCSEHAQIIPTSTKIRPMMMAFRI